MIKAVVTADNHLNNHYAKMTPVQLEERRKRLRQVFRETTDFALDQGVQLYLHAGDLFDMPDPRTSELIAVTREFRKLHEAGIPIFCIGGTHDVPKMRTAGATPQRLFHEGGQAHVFTDPEDPSPVSLDLGGMKISIGGIPTDPRIVRGEDPLEGVEYKRETDFSILLTHYGIEGYIHADADEPVLTRSSISEMDGVDLFIAGHIHKSERFGIGDKTILIPGSTERMTFGEIGIQPGFWLLEIESPQDIRTTRISTHAQPMKILTVRTTELPEEDPTEYVINRIQAVSNPDQLLQCRIAGPITREQYHQLHQREIWLMGCRENFYFDWNARNLTVENVKASSTGIRLGISPKDEITDVAESMISESSNTQEKQLIEEARNRALDLYSGR